MSRYFPGAQRLASLALLALLPAACAVATDSELLDGDDDNGVATDGGASGGASSGGAPDASGGAASGGAPASGGAVGTGGEPASGGSNGGGECPGARGDGRGLEASYKVNHAEAVVDAISNELHLKNGGAFAAPLQELKVRYYYTSELPAPAKITIWWTQVNDPGGNLPTDQLTTEIVALSAPVEGADTYVEFGFGAGAPSLVAGQKVVISWKIEAENTSAGHRFTQTDDYSFDASKTEPTPWDRVVVLRGGEIVWGEPPC